MRYRWKEVRAVINSVLDSYIAEYGVPPSVRTVLYRLRDLGLLPATEGAYKALSRQLTRWREEGFVDWRKVRDGKEERVADGLEPWEHYRDRPLTAEEVLDLVRRRIDLEFTVNVNPWLDQRYRVIVFVEKNAEYPVVKRLVEEAFPYGVYRVHCGCGYDSCTWKFRLAEDVRALASAGYRPVVLAFSDFDPSGEDIPRDFVDKLRQYSGVEDLVFERVAVTHEQVAKYGLTGFFRDDEEYWRFIRDPRRPSFERRYGQVKVELSELLSKPKDQVVELVRGAISKYFDHDVYEARTRPRLEEARRRAMEAKERTLRELEGLLRGGGVGGEAPCTWTR